LFFSQNRTVQQARKLLEKWVPIVLLCNNKPPQ
jgi:hypothetical protein